MLEPFLTNCLFNRLHFSRPEKTVFLKKLVNHLKVKLNFRITTLENNLEYLLRKKMQIPEHQRIICGLALGYVKFYPDIKTVMHGGRKVMRGPLKSYLIFPKKVK